MADLLVLEPSAVRFVFQRADGCSWIGSAPRFGAVAAHFPESLRKRRFVASFWAPEVFFSSPEKLGGWYRDSPPLRTRAQLDWWTANCIALAWLLTPPECEAPLRYFWSPELPEVRFDQSGALHICWKRTHSERTGTEIRRFWRPVFASLLLLVLALPAGAQTLFGVVSKVSDGDTLMVGKARIRLFGIDAPESRQECRLPSGPAYRCGDSAEAALLALAPVGSSISCSVRDVDRYGRLVAVCSVASRAGSDLGREMVLAGWAVAYRKYSDRYVAEEIAARNARRGLWAGSFRQPEEWRKGARR